MEESSFGDKLRATYTVCSVNRIICLLIEIHFRSGTTINVNISLFRYPTEELEEKFTDHMHIKYTYLLCSEMLTTVFSV